MASLTASMSDVHALHNLVLLPSGDVVAGGGDMTGVQCNDGGGVPIPGNLNPATGVWGC